MENQRMRFGFWEKSSRSEILRVRGGVVLAVIFGALLFAKTSRAQTGASSDLPSETPATFTPVTTSFDYVKRDVMIPMRDGVKLHTVILVPKGAKNAPILLTRTPYNATALTSHAASAHLGPILNGYDNATDVIVEGGYIRVVQDVRGKYGSEGDYVMNRPLHGPQNPTPVDHATDTYDTIDWLVKNIPESNGKVGILGISYDGFSAADGAGQSASRAQGLGADESHGRRLDGRRLVPQRRLPRAEHALHLRSGSHARVTTPSGGPTTSTTTTCSWKPARPANSAAATAWSRSASGAKLLEHPSYDSFWQDQAMDQHPRGAAAESAGHAGAQPVGPGRHLRRTRRLQGASSRRTRTTTKCFWCWAPGITARRSTTAARSARSNSTAIPGSTSGRKFCAHSWISI